MTSISAEDEGDWGLEDRDRETETEEKGNSLQGLNFISLQVSMHFQQETHLGQRRI